MNAARRAVVQALAEAARARLDLLLLAAETLAMDGDAWAGSLAGVARASLRAFAVHQESAEAAGIEMPAGTREAL